jgi:hypothetical protein
METRNLDHRRQNFKGRTQFSAAEVSIIVPTSLAPSHSSISLVV